MSIAPMPVSGEVFASMSEIWTDETSEASVTDSFQQFTSTESWKVDEDVEEKTVTPRAVSLPSLLSKYQSLSSYAREHTRATIIRELNREPDQLLGVVMRTFLNSKEPGRIHDAIDLVSSLGPYIDQHLTVVLGDAPLSGIDASIADDYRYVLVMSVSRSKAVENYKPLLEWWSQNHNRTVREASVEALGEIGVPWARSLLSRIAETDQDEFIRSLAHEQLANQ